MLKVYIVENFSCFGKAYYKVLYCFVAILNELVSLISFSVVCLQYVGRPLCVLILHFVTLLKAFQLRSGKAQEFPFSCVCYELLWVKNQNLFQRKLNDS